MGEKLLAETLLDYFGELIKVFPNRAKCSAILARCLSETEPGEVEQVVNLCTGNLEAAKIGVNSEQTLNGQLWVKSRESPIIVSVLYDQIIKARHLHGPAKEQLLGNLITRLGTHRSEWLKNLVAGRNLLKISETILVDAIMETLDMPTNERQYLENAYEARADLAHVVGILWRDGLEAIKSLLPIPGIPVLPESQTRATQNDLDLLWETFGPCYVHTKLDGYRCQIHKENETVWLFVGRNVRDWTSQLQRMVDAALSQISVASTILESELVPLDPITGQFLPRSQFKNTSHYLAVVWDVLLINGEDIRNLPYKERRAHKNNVILRNFPPRLITTSQDAYITSPQQLKDYFQERCRLREEGIILINPTSKYESKFGGKRSKERIKIKTVDPVDAVIVGYEFIKGQNVTSKVLFLLAVYDNERNLFVTIGKTAAGLKLQERKMLYQECKHLKTDSTESIYHRNLSPSTHLVVPSIVVEVLIDAIYPSNEYTCGAQASESGFGAQHLRFKSGLIRTDKAVKQITTAEEFLQINQQPGVIPPVTKLDDDCRESEDTNSPSRLQQLPLL